MITAPDSLAVGIAAANALQADPITYSAFLPQVGLSEASHLVLFPADLCEMVLWLTNTADFLDAKGRRGPLQVFVGAPTIESFSAVRRGTLSRRIESQSADPIFFARARISLGIFCTNISPRAVEHW